MCIYAYGQGSEYLCIDDKSACRFLGRRLAVSLSISKICRAEYHVLLPGQSVLELESKPAEHGDPSLRELGWTSKHLRQKPTPPLVSGLIRESNFGHTRSSGRGDGLHCRCRAVFIVLEREIPNSRIAELKRLKQGVLGQLSEEATQKSSFCIGFTPKRTQSYMHVPSSLSTRRIDVRLYRQAEGQKIRAVKATQAIDLGAMAVL